MTSLNRQITLVARPKGFPKETDFLLVESPIPALKNGEFLVKTSYVSVDPYMRGRMNEGKSYIGGIELGEVFGGGSVGMVIESKCQDFRVGDAVAGAWRWQEYAVLTPSAEEVNRVDLSIAPISTALGILGMPGMTAYFGLLSICNPQPGETVVVSGAAGAVGSAVGQIAKIKGCRVVGVAGSREKVDYVTRDLGFDAAFNYRDGKDHTRRLKELCPNGIDVYFDNVGGPVTDAVFQLINTRARISVCGQISQYNSVRPETGPRNLFMLIVRQAKAEGFLVFQFADRYAEATAEMARWLKQGRLKYRESIVEGIENTPRAFIGMLQGENIGKQLVKVS
ncbi:MAG: NADP-dependent oxidoreductase [Candidatus Hydrogenedentes bacterium]|nr:NADP-dependent oxidoreductase [Candidatus Hydrogenedentota bacterium]